MSTSLIAKHTKPIQIHSVFKKFGVSPTLKTAMIANKLKAEGKKIYKLGFGESPFPVHPDVMAALQENAHQKSYLNVQGLEKLRQVIAEYHNIQNQTTYTADNIFVAPGSKQTLLYTLDSIKNDYIVPSPCWVSHKNQPDLLERQVAMLQTTQENNFKPTIQQLEQTIDQLSNNPMLLMNFPNNPTGQTYSEKELQEIANIDKDFLVLSDEIYGNVSFDNHVSISKYLPERTLTSSGTSKWMGAGGWRFGYLIIPDTHDQLKVAMNNYISESYSAVSSPIQFACIKAYQDFYEDSIQNYIQGQKRIFKTLQKEIVTIFRSVGIKVLESQGGFYLYPNFENFREKLAKHGIHNSEQLTSAIMLETGVSLIGASKFGESNDNLSFRLCYVDFDGEKALNASYNQEVDKKFIYEYCEHTLEGCQKLAEWASNL